MYDPEPFLRALILQRPEEDPTPILMELADFLEDQGDVHNAGFCRDGINAIQKFCEIHHLTQRSPEKGQRALAYAFRSACDQIISLWMERCTLCDPYLYAPPACPECGLLSWVRKRFHGKSVKEAMNNAMDDPRCSFQRTHYEPRPPQ